MEYVKSHSRISLIIPKSFLNKHHLLNVQLEIYFSKQASFIKPFVKIPPFFILKSMSCALITAIRVPLLKETHKI